MRLMKGRCPRLCSPCITCSQKIPPDVAVFGHRTGKIRFMAESAGLEHFVVSARDGDMCVIPKRQTAVVVRRCVPSQRPFMVLWALISAAINDPSVPFPAGWLGDWTGCPGWNRNLSTGPTCDACLYTRRWDTRTHSGPQLRNAAIVGTIIGVIAAGTGVIGNIVNWLILLGLIVPPIGGAIMADYYVIRGERGFGVKRNVQFNWAAIVAVIAGILVGYYVNKTYPNFLFGAAGIATSFILYAILGKIAAALLERILPISRAAPRRGRSEIRFGPIVYPFGSAPAVIARI